MSKQLNIVTLDIPYPPDYGGMIDAYYRIESLKKLGISIHLHCFEYGRSHSNELEALCTTVRYYQRKTGFMQQFSHLPYTVYSRCSPLLLNNILKNDYPVLFDGVHTAYYLNHPALSGRKKLVRLHNIEYLYYNTLANNEPNLLKKLYFKIESIRLNFFEKKLINATYLLPVSSADETYLSRRYLNLKCIPAFHPYKEVVSVPGKGEFILYHGDLSVNENEYIAESLISNVFSRLPFSCIIAGKNPSKRLLSLAAGKTNIRIISNPGNEEMSDLIRDAHIHLLPSLSSNGFKIKLLVALFAGRHCIANSIIADNYNLGSICHITNSAGETIDKIHLLMKEEFTGEMILKRRTLHSENFNNLINAKKIIKLIFPE